LFNYITDVSRVYKRDNRNGIYIQHVQYAGLDEITIVKTERLIYALNSYYWID